MSRTRTIHTRGKGDIRLGVRYEPDEDAVLKAVQIVLDAALRAEAATTGEVHPIATPLAGPFAPTLASGGAN